MLISRAGPGLSQEATACPAVGMAGYGTLEAVLDYADIADYVSKDDDSEEAVQRHPLAAGRHPIPSHRASQRWTRSRLLLSSVAFFLLVCVVVTVRRPVVSKRAEQTLRTVRTTMRLSAAGKEELPFVRASNSYYGEVKLPTTKVYGLDMIMEPHRETLLEVMGDASSLKVEWYVAMLDRATGEATGEELYKGVSESDDGSITVTCTSPGDFYRVQVNAYDADGGR